MVLDLVRVCVLGKVFLENEIKTSEIMQIEIKLDLSKGLTTY